MNKIAFPLYSLLTFYAAVSYASEKSPNDSTTGRYNVDGRTYSWSIKSSQGLTYAQVDGPIQPGALDSGDKRGMTWEMSKVFCATEFSSRQGQLPSVESSIKLRNVSPEQKASLPYIFWLDVPQKSVERSGTTSYATTVAEFASYIPICILGEAIKSKTEKQNTVNANQKNAKTVTLNSTTDSPKASSPQKTDSGKAITAPLPIVAERKTYPFTKSTTYSSTYRNTDQKRAMTTMNEERIKGEKSFGFVASWTTVSETAPQCETTKPKNLYWICKTTVTYSGQSYFSQEDKKGPSKVIGK